MILADILRHKGTETVAVSPADTIITVLEVLADKGIGAVLVLDAGRRLVGIVSERDIVRALRHHGAQTLTMTARQLMTAELTTATPRTSVAETRELMTAGRFRHVPVLENGVLAGLVSIGDVVKASLREQEEDIGSLRAFIAGEA